MLINGAVAGAESLWTSRRPDAGVAHAEPINNEFVGSSKHAVARGLSVASVVGPLRGRCRPMSARFRLRRRRTSSGRSLPPCTASCAASFWRSRSCCPGVYARSAAENEGERAAPPLTRPATPRRKPELRGPRGAGAVEHRRAGAATLCERHMFWDA